MIRVPEGFARSTVEREGGPGARWIAELPLIVDGLLEQWGCVPEGAVLHGESESSSRCAGRPGRPPC